MSKILIKMPMKPHRQKVLTPDGQEVRLQQFANRMAANELRGAGGDASGDQFTSSRDKLMRDMVANPESHNIKFMGERVPFEGQNLEQMLSEPDVAGEQAAIDSQFGDDEPLDFTNKIRDTRSADSYKTGDTMTPQDKLMSEIMDEKGNLKPDSQFMDDEEDEDDMPSPEEDDRPKNEDELLERVMAQKAVSHIRGFRDAWMVIKNMQEPEFCDFCGDPYRCSCPSKREMNERIIEENELKRFLGGGSGTSPVR